MLANLTRVRKAWSVPALCFGIAGCGGGSTPASVPTPVATPRPTPPPRVNLTLDAPADHYVFSSPLARVSAGETFDLTFTLLRINESPDSKFSYTVELWLWSTTTTHEDFVDSGLALALDWRGESDWLLGYFTPDQKWQNTRRHLQIQLGDQHALRLVRTTDGVAEFLLDGNGILTLADAEPMRVVLARVVGTAAEFSYQPLGTAGLREVFLQHSAVYSCGECQRHAD